MAQLSEFEKQRQANIARNKALLQKLNLGNISNEIYAEIKSETASPKPSAAKRRKVAPKKQEPILPTRRSRRIAGVKMEDSEEGKRMIAEAEEQKRKNEELEKLKSVRLNGDLRLVDLLSDKSGIKLESSGDEDNMLLRKFSNIGKSISMGDFYETMVKRTDANDESINQLRESFSEMKIFPDYNPLDVKITPNRMTAIQFHPSIDKRLVLGGDTVGYLGLWSVDDKKTLDDALTEDGEPEYEPEITIMKLHGKTVAKITMSKQDAFKMYSCSYDGSIRSIDMKTLQTSEVYSLDDQYGDALGVSDINFSYQDPNLCYFSTLTGQFGIKDLRTNDDIKLLRLHDKKIGSFAINPKFDKQIATASLDRSLKIWDLRNISIGKAEFSFYNSSDDAPHLVGSYSSRLSISCADWNPSGDIVVNGYDDTINVFNLGQTEKFKKDYRYPVLPSAVDNEQLINLAPQHKIRHNCQTGRWVSILKSKWQLNPRDGIEKFVIANMNRYFDIYTQNGVQIAHLGDRELVGAVPAAVALHPTENWVIGGSASGKGYLFV